MAFEGVDSDASKFYQENGFVVIEGFLNEDEVKALKDATTKLVEKCCNEMPLSIFSQQEQSKDTFFAESGDKIRGFLEEHAVDKEGNILLPREKALNKMAHNLHNLNPTFKSITFSDKVKLVLKEITTMDKPTVIQSMIIFKNPKVGGVVKPHQDGSFLYTEPLENGCIGFWIALDEATLENGCLKFVPGSHKSNALHERFVRNPDQNSDQLFIFQGEPIHPPPKEKLVAAVCKPGDLVLINGLVIHQSEPNTSDKPRMAYTFHVYDAKAKWSTENWLQPTDQGNFTPVY